MNIINSSYIQSTALIPDIIVDTRANILALQSANNLIPGVHYQITDPSTTTTSGVIGGSITVHAVATNELSQQGIWNNSLDTKGWYVDYDINTNLIQACKDNRGNEVYGNTAFQNFRWGIATFNFCKVLDNANWICLGSTANYQRVVVSQQSNLKTSNMTGAMTNVILERNSTVTLTAATNANISHTVFASGSSVNAGSTNNLSVQHCQLHNSTITYSAGTNLSMYGVTLSNGSSIQHSSTGASTIQYVNLNAQSRIVNSGAGNLSVYYCNLASNAYVQSTLTVLATNNVYYTTISANSYISFSTTSANNNIYYSNITSSSNMTLNATTGGTLYYNNLDSSSSMSANTLTGINAYGNSLKASSNLSLNNNTALTQLFYNNLQSGSGISINNSGFACIAQYSSVSNIANLQIINPTAATTASYHTLNASTQRYITGSHSYNHTLSGGFINSTTCTTSSRCYIFGNFTKTLTLASYASLGRDYFNNSAGW